MGYLTTVFNTYYYSDDEKQKHNLKEGFKKIIWNSLPYKKLDRFFKYKVSYNNIKEEKVLELFEKYKFIEYKVLKSRYNLQEVEKEDLVKARINSLYAYYFDKEVYLRKDYYRALAQYKNTYFKYLNGEIDDIFSTIKELDNNIEKLKEESLNRKHDMDWEFYRGYIDMCFDRIFDNFIPIDEKIEQGVFYSNHILDWDEDNYIVGYISKSLSGYVKNYINEKNKKRYTKCCVCGNIIKKMSNKQKYCKPCAKDMDREKAITRMRRKRNVRNREFN